MDLPEDIPVKCARWLGSNQFLAQCLSSMIFSSRRFYLVEILRIRQIDFVAVE
jgi:hypothetical protein